MMPRTDNTIQFRGLVGARAVSAAHAELSRAGTRRYILIGLDDGSILDISGVEPGDTVHPIALLDPDGRQFKGEATAPVLTHDARCHLQLAASLRHVTEAGDEHTVDIEGLLAWLAPDPSDPPRDGTLQIRSADRMLPPALVVLQPFGDGWQLSGIVNVKDGHSVNLVLFTEPPALHLIETRTHKGEPDIRRLPCRALSVRVVEAEEHIVVRFQAEVDDRLTGFQPLIGQFITERRS